MDWDELPERWEVVKLKEVASSLKGKKPQILSDEYFENSVPYLDIKAIEKKEIRQYADIKSSAIATPQDVLIVWDGARCGWVGTGVAGAAGSTIAIIRPKNINSQYLFYFLKTHFKQLNHDVKGIGIPHLKPELLWSLPVPLPPLSEQIRIAARLDELNARIAAARQKIQRLQATLAHARRSVLNAAFSNPESHWEMKKIEEISKINYGFTEKASFDEIGPKFLRITDIKDNGVDWETVPYCKINDKDFEKMKLIDGDIVFARTGATTGKSYLIKNPPKAVFASYLIKIQINQNKILPEFLFLFFQTEIYWKKIDAGITGTAQGGFNATKLGNLEFPLPPLSEQVEIVRRVEALTAGLSAAESRAARIAAALDALPQALLRQAFAGKL